MTPTFDALLRTLYLTDGLTLSEIAVRLQLSAETVRRALIEAGIPRRPRGTPAGKHLPNHGQTVDRDGYHLRLIAGHPGANASGYVREHRLIVESQIGRFLERAEVVAHINGDRSDNSPGNLKLYPSSNAYARDVMQGNSRAAGDVGNEKRRIRRLRSPEQMLFELARLRTSLGREIRRVDLHPPQPSHRAVTRAFGSWQAGVAEALAHHGMKDPDQAHAGKTVTVPAVHASSTACRVVRAVSGRVGAEVDAEHIPNTKNTLRRE